MPIALNCWAGALSLRTMAIGENNGMFEGSQVNERGRSGHPFQGFFCRLDGNPLCITGQQWPPTINYGALS